MAVATYCYYEKVRRMMLTTIVLYLLNICTFKIKSNWNIFDFQEWHQNTKIFISYKTQTVETKTKTCQDQPNLVVTWYRFFYRMTTFPRLPFLSDLKSGCLIQVWLYSTGGQFGPLVFIIFLWGLFYFLEGVIVASYSDDTTSYGANKKNDLIIKEMSTFLKFLFNDLTLIKWK